MLMHIYSGAAWNILASDSVTCFRNAPAKKQFIFKVMRPYMIF